MPLNPETYEFSELREEFEALKKRVESLDEDSGIDPELLEKMKSYADMLQSRFDQLGIVGDTEWPALRSKVFEEYSELERAYQRAVAPPGQPDLTQPAMEE
jgi:hypothetical protein